MTTTKPAIVTLALLAAMIALPATAVADPGNGQGKGQGVGQGSGNAAGSQGNGNGQGNGGQGSGNGQGSNYGHGIGNGAGQGGQVVGPVGPAGQTPAAPSVAVPDQDEALAAVRSGAAMPLANLLARVAPQLGGTVLDARLVTIKGFLIYELKVLSQDGRTVTTQYYYARSGNRVGAP